MGGGKRDRFVAIRKKFYSVLEVVQQSLAMANARQKINLYLANPQCEVKV